MAKFNFHMKSFSSSATATTTATDVPQRTPESSKREQRTPKEYFVSLRDRRLFSLRRSQSQKDLKTTATGRTSSPLSFSGRLKRNISPKTPQFTSLFSPKVPTLSENSRHHRQYAVSLSHLPRMSASAMLDEQSISPDPESPSEMTRIRRLNPRKSKIPPVIPPVIITAPSGEALGLQEIREPLLKSDIMAQFMPIPPLDLQTPPSYRSRSRERSSSSSKISPELTSTSKEDTSYEEALPRQTAISGFHRIVEILQEAARNLDDDPAFSRATIFHYLAPLVVFICILALAILVPRNYSSIKNSFGANASVFVPVVVLGAVGCSLVLLEGCLRVAGILCQSFCEMDLEATFRTNEIADNNGGRIGGVDLVVGMFASG
ncbi:hypothetical protein CVT25_004890 [Psilocybe cyanescens]|uniref:Uncharacterized protein n=1 Tax=Psilocybe cyanescens TaxID=93625 RepID=A0A409XBG3_PSICY|nr:hypothetical protein CVT25_004890 [Psilocybe cyanescens]